MAAYVDACVAEIRQAPLVPASSVFFGGGTPSLLAPDQLLAILTAVPRVPGAEVSVECNPETVTDSLLSAYRAGGVTRLSFGVQSMVDSVLSSLGRQHDPASVRRAIAAAASAGFGDNYSVDLIYGAAGESMGDWARTVEEVLSLEPVPAHISAYALTVESGTPLAADPRRHPDGDDQADKYALADDAFHGAGLTWYELSNWARLGAECRHNQLYWEQGSYRGIGCSAHSHAGRPDGTARRWWNVRTPERYQRLVASGGSAESAGEELSISERRLEGQQLALRTRSGVAVDALVADPLLDGLVDRRGDRFVLTRQGRLLANEVALRLTG